MSLEHKRPLLAFAVVVIACVVILANAIRSEALVSFLRSGASHVVAGLPLGDAPHEPGHRISPAAPAPAAEVAPAVEAAVETPRAIVAVRQPRTSQTARTSQTSRTAQTAPTGGAGHQHVQGHPLGHPLGHLQGHLHGLDRGLHLGHARGHQKAHGLRGLAQARSHAHGHRAHVRDGQAAARGHGELVRLARSHAHLPARR